MVNSCLEHHKDSRIESEANSVINSIKDKVKKFQVNENMDESVNLKRSNSTSPVGVKAKVSNITIVSADSEIPKTLEVKCLEMEEDMKLVKKECADVKVENSKFRKNLEEINVVKKENINLTKQFKDQELEVVKAMKAIEERIEEETNTAMKSIDKQIEVEVKKKAAERATGSDKGKKEFKDLEKRVQEETGRGARRKE